MKSYYLVFFLPLLIVKYSTANTVEPFHEPEESVNSQFYLPPPPVNDDPAFRYDKDAYFRGYAMKDSPRWKQAAIDADVSVENIARIFSPVIGVKINKHDTPETWKMLQNLLTMGGYYATASAKKYYMRTRPFVLFKHSTCRPQDEDALRKNGSYPSGHTAYGTLLALVLSQAKPERAQELARRGWEFGQSRVICGAHWQSDVDAGRYVGAVEFARLQTIPAFQESLAKVRQELNNKNNLLSKDE
ncbi:non-specific acid phosphatase [Salmonella enterica]|uniref:Acid phosphatase n=1 Tax=Salmonella enterica I TaxID=59201 RepID=A0A7Z1PZI7_SALET|nr:non-specific acid phosphatase [Salmonella enterica]ECC3882606.1 non-specific acid phosphatase [Salmonella enterica subsp. diarizonae]ECT9717912.1 non-specific acid phosphatase [Salmonella enterica subsp. diarizonae str. CFSAN000553]EGE4753160.1 non-specific acid phosphatase [Salmonella enterica subsp. diarizonae serovar 38:[k]:z35]SUG60960.1 acid phosphatase [Salmonella enterica subsp. arizonae]HAF0277100.1 non-specific acid phosphatase [Salmonella enterica subsp. diarizonae serovar 38:[k]: